MAAVSPAGSAPDSAKLALLKDALYDQCVANGDETRLYDQKDLISLGVVSDIHALLPILKGLIDDKLLISVGRGGVANLWKWRSVADAQKYRALNREQAMVYEMIDDAGADGIWSRLLKNKLGLHDSVLKQHLKFLESKGFIKDMKSVEHPNKKMYIKASLRPSDKATGGPWYTDSNLDEAFINDLLKVIFDLITQQSTYRSVHGGSGHKEKQPKNGILRGDSEAVTNAKGKKRAAEDISTDDAQPAPREKHKQHRERKQAQLLPLPAGYNKYPTVRQIAEFISTSGITNDTTLTISDVQQLVDVLVYDGLIEPVRVGKAKGYRTVRAAWVDPTPLTALMRDNSMDDDVMGLEVQDMGAGPMSNGLTEAPCGRCPVFDICEEGGPVNPGNCVYFQRWLGD